MTESLAGWQDVYPEGAPTILSSSVRCLHMHIDTALAP